MHRRRLGHITAPREAHGKYKWFDRARIFNNCRVCKSDMLCYAMLYSTMLSCCAFGHLKTVYGGRFGSLSLGLNSWEHVWFYLFVETHGSTFHAKYLFKFIETIYASTRFPFLAKTGLCWALKSSTIYINQT